MMLVAGEDLLFSILAPIYIYILSQLVIPPVTPTKPPRLFGGIWYFKYYVNTGGFVGAWVPLVYLLGAYYQGMDLSLVQGALSHTFLLLCQIFAEIGFSKLNRISLPARAAVPIFYNAWRMFTLYNWVKADFFQIKEYNNPSGFAKQWLLFGRLLAVANLAFWSFNLFCFLIPIYLPLAWRQYFEAEARNKTK